KTIYCKSVSTFVSSQPYLKKPMDTNPKKPGVAVMIARTMRASALIAAIACVTQFSVNAQISWNVSAGSVGNWSAGASWLGGVAPTPASDVIFGAIGATNTVGVNNIVDTTTTINSLWYRLNFTSGTVTNIVTQINPGVTLNVTGVTNLPSGGSFPADPSAFLVGTNVSLSKNFLVTTITGAGGTLNVNSTNGWFMVGNFISTGNHTGGATARAVLDMSGLDTFIANV